MPNVATTIFLERQERKLTEQMREIAEEAAARNPGQPLGLSLGRYLTDRYRKDAVPSPSNGRRTPAERVEQWHFEVEEGFWPSDTFPTLAAFARHPFKRDCGPRYSLDDWRADQALRATRARREARRIPLRLRGEVLESGPCRYCGDPAEVVDHVYPVARGGTRRRRNLAPACRPCNVDKGDLTVQEWRAERLEMGCAWPPQSRSREAVR